MSEEFCSCKQCGKKVKPVSKSMTLVFELSMPNVGSWNGNWTGANDCHVIIQKFGSSKKGIAKAQELIDNSPYYYNFGDGWGASISVRCVSGPEIKSLKKANRGFCGYEWMVRSIKENGAILATDTD